MALNKMDLVSFWALNLSYIGKGWTNKHDSTSKAQARNSYRLVRLINKSWIVCHQLLLNSIQISIRSNHCGTTYKCIYDATIIRVLIMMMVLDKSMTVVIMLLLLLVNIVTMTKILNNAINVTIARAMIITIVALIRTLA